MATNQAPTLADITEKAQALQSEIETRGVNASDHKQIVTDAKALLALLDQLQPHINRAQTAFGGQEAAVSQINSLRNKLNQVIAAYS